MYKDVEVKELVGLTLTDIKNSDTEIVFTTDAGRVFKMYHRQDCCETVTVEDICGDLDDLIGSPIVVAEEATNSGQNAEYDCYTWTFYKLDTQKGGVTIRWLGSSNGYYSEHVDFSEIVND